MDRLTEAELEEGRRLLKKSEHKTYTVGEIDKPLAEWLIRHADAMLSAAADAETIRKEAVREFAQSLLSDLSAAKTLLVEVPESKWPIISTIGTIQELAAARGVTLETKEQK